MYSLHTQTEAPNQSLRVGRNQCEGRTGICVFEGIIKNVEILDGTLLPFVKDVHPSAHKFMQDNDPKYTSWYAEQGMRENGIN